MLCYLRPPSLLQAFTSASFVHRPSPNPIMRMPLTAGAKAAMYFAIGEELHQLQNETIRYTSRFRSNSLIPTILHIDTMFARCVDVREVHIDITCTSTHRHLITHLHKYFTIWTSESHGKGVNGVTRKP